jgi:hypothetical protein
MTGTGTNSFTLSAADIVPLSGNQPYYNSYAAPNWSQALMTANNYMSVWLVAVPVTSDAGSQPYRYFWIQGQSQGSLSAQQLLTPSSLNVGLLSTIFTEFVFLAQVIIRYIGGNWEITSVVNLFGTKQSVQAAAGSGISEAPLDGKLYVRKDAAWEELVIA